MAAKADVKDTILRNVMSLMVSTEIEREVYERLRKKYEDEERKAA